MSGQIWDAAIVGGGLAGRSAAVALARAGLDVLHLAPKGPPDRRTSALMQPSVEFLRDIGVIADPAAIGVPLQRIRIIDATHRVLRAPETLFDSADAGLAAFGWNFANVALAEALEGAAGGLPTLTTREVAMTGALIGSPSILTLADGDRVAARLVVGADGRNSAVRAAAGLAAREHKFTQAALVCDLQLGRPLRGDSVEFHYENGPFTLVPAGGNRANLVWIDDATVLADAKAGGVDRLKVIFAEKSQRLFGSIDLASPAFVFPLSTLLVSAAGAGGVALVGEAAHAFPPIGAQGLNLGLRDVAELAAAVRALPRADAGWAVAVSENYAARRAGDLARTGAAVDALFRSLLADMLPAQAVRAGGLWALKLLPVLRRQAISAGIGAS